LRIILLSTPAAKPLAKNIVGFLYNLIDVFGRVRRKPGKNQGDAVLVCNLLCFIISATYSNARGSFQMQRKFALMALIAITTQSSCGTDEKDPSGETSAAPEAAALTAVSLGEQSILSNAEYLGTAPYAGADLEKGEQQAMICRACHTLDEGGVHMIGPNLYGMFGQAVGTQEGFAYSKAVQEVDFIWTPRALDAWLAQPAKFLPGNMMSFPGVRREEDRANLIAFLIRATDNNEQGIVGE